MASFFVRTNRIFTPVRKYSWLFVILVAFGGLWFPKLGLLMIPLMAALGIMGFFKGKYWCGNFCPHGSLFDSVLYPYSANRKIPDFLKSKTASAAAFLWFMIMLGQRLFHVFAAWGAASSWDKLGYIFVINYLVVTIIGSTLALLISPRAWCSICPMGTFQILMYKLSKLLGLNQATDEKITIANPEMCHICGKCSRVCPMQLTPYLEFSNQNQFDNEACIRCSTCVENCPPKILSLSDKETSQQIQAETDNEGYDTRQKISAVIEDIKILKDDVREYTFRLQEPAAVDYKAGQFILVKVQDNPQMYRAYSISSYNEDGNSLAVTIKKAPSGYGTEIIFDGFRVGDNVELDGPLGKELVVSPDAEKVLLVAGGIGITPFIPIVRDVIENKPAVKDVTLVYGVNSEKEFLYDQSFNELAQQSSKFRYEKVVASDVNWPGQKGFVTDVIKEMDLEGYKVYMCGPQPMINAMLKVLKERGVEEKNIRYESA